MGNLPEPMRLRSLIIIGFILVCTPFADGQSQARWSFTTRAPDERIKTGTSVEFQLKAEIEEGWHLYALDQPEGGPIPTTIKTAENSPFRLLGDVSAPKPTVKPDQNFLVEGKPLETKFYERTVNFGLSAEALEDTSINELAVNVRFQLCNDTFCLPPKTYRVSHAGTEEVKRVVAAQPPTDPPKQPPTFTSTAVGDDGSIWSFIWLALTFGAISLLTPCVFPMIPITVSYFMNHAHGDRGKTIKLATVYSAGIVATFSLLGMALAVFLGAAGITLFAANPWVNLVIAAIFIAFAFNLFGFYEITIPASVLTKLDKLTRAEEGKGSAYIGALLMGLTFTLTSFTCTSPFIGTILVSTAQGNWQMPLLGMLVFSTVFALPFFVLATVPRLLHSLPRSGGWLNSVKVVMGFLEVAAAVKFLSNIDLVWGAAYASSSGPFYGWAFTRELVLAIWIVIGLAISGYILGLFRLRNDSPVKKLTMLRIIFAGAFFAICIYLATGILGKKLGELESFLPPKNAESSLNILGNKNEESKWITNDLEEAKRQAVLQNKKIFIDFTGYTCTNCRWMEANIFPQQDVRHALEQFVLVRLYTDGEGEIYERQQQLEQDLFGTVALPYYAIMDADGKPVAAFPGLTRSSAEFIDFLNKGKQN
jgi:thiol:disulfide interchange protein DsbD